MNAGIFERPDDTVAPSVRSPVSDMVGSSWLPTRGALLLFFGLIGSLLPGRTNGMVGSRLPGRGPDGGVTTPALSLRGPSGRAGFDAAARSGGSPARLLLMVSRANVR